MRKSNMVWSLVLSLVACLSIGAMAIEQPALDRVTDLNTSNGVKIDNLKVTRDKTPTISITYNGIPATVSTAQPKLDLQQNGHDWSGFAICIDTRTGIFLEPGNNYEGYHFYTWQGAKNNIDNHGNPDHKTGTIAEESDATWNKLTTMWTKAVVDSDKNPNPSSDAKRSALQVATWIGTTGIWSGYTETTNADGTYNWNGGNLKLSNIDSGVYNQAKYYLSQAQNNSSYSNNFRVIADSRETFVAAVPEPGTIVAALSVLAPAGLFFRRKRKSS
ncbi:MAG: PEP-CTERM sorting domain-containing protein [Armatimonadota bacterium]